MIALGAKLTSVAWHGAPVIPWTADPTANCVPARGAQTPTGPWRVPPPVMVLILRFSGMATALSPCATPSFRVSPSRALAATLLELEIRQDALKVAMAAEPVERPRLPPDLGRSTGTRSPTCVRRWTAAETQRPSKRRGDWWTA